MKILLFNGSTRKNGCTYLALSEIAKTLEKDGMEAEIMQLGGTPVRDCIACNQCAGRGKCIFSDDIVNEWIECSMQVLTLLPINRPQRLSLHAGQALLLRWM